MGKVWRWICFFVVLTLLVMLGIGQTGHRVYVTFDGRPILLISRGYCLPMFGSTDMCYTLDREPTLTKIVPFRSAERQKLRIRGQETYAAF